MRISIRQQLSVYLLVATLWSLLPFCSGAGFFITNGSLTWYPPARPLKKEIESLVTENTKNDGVYSILSQSNVIDPNTGKACLALDDSTLGKSPPFPFMQRKSNYRKALVVVMPQLGDSDSFEYAEVLRHAMPDLEAANIALRIIGIGNAKSAQMFSLYTGIPLENLRVDPTGSIHQKLDLHRGPNWDVPSWLPQEALEWFAENVCANDNEKIPAKEVVRAWMNYAAMSAGIASQGTIREILRGFFGDKSAPERIHPEEIIRAGPITVKGTSDFQIGPIKYRNFWNQQEGCLRPLELASVRLRSMMEVLTKFDHYVPDQRFLDWRGATFLLDENSCEKNGRPLYKHHDQGPFGYSESMSRPLSFLSNYIGMERARNPIGLKDPEFLYD